MKLFIANCTRQNWVVHYRLDFTQAGELDARRQNQPAKQQDIPPGRQVMIGSADMHISQIDDIVEQLKKYGLVGVADVPGLKSKVKKFDPKSQSITPLVFNVDRFVPADTMRMVQEINGRIYVDQGKERRARAAVAVNEIVHNKVANELMSAGIETQPTEKIDVGFEQLDQSEAGEKRIEEGYRVDKSAPVAPAPKPKRRRAA